jgi:hypothetical protein
MELEKENIRRIGRRRLKVKNNSKARGDNVHEFEQENVVKSLLRESKLNKMVESKRLEKLERISNKNIKIYLFLVHTLFQMMMANPFMVKSFLVLKMICLIQGIFQ